MEQSTEARTLVEFLRELLSEDEQAARRANATADHAWASSSNELIHAARCELGSFYDPARVLREVEAKRQLIALYERADQNARTLIDRESCGDARIERAALLGALRALAMPYVDHPDYRQEWSAT